MATAELKRYLVERLVDLDPTLSDELGSAMYTKVIDPLMKRLGTDPFEVNVVEFITQRIREDFPELDMESAGSFLKDAVAKPLALMLEPLQREIQQLRTQQSVLNYEQLTSIELDALLANVLSTRIIGDYARGSVRLFFSSPKTVFIDPTGITFSTVSGVNFIAEEATAFFPSDMTPQGNLYYIDVEVQSQVAHVGTNISANSIRTASGIEGVVRVTNPKAMSGGVTRENNESFVARAERSLSERSLNTERGIETTLFNSYDDLVSVEVVGFGEEEMQRDLLTASVEVADTDKVGSAIITTATITPITLPSQGVVVTNKLRLLGGNTVAKADEIKAASFLKLFEPNEDFDSKLLSRVRGVEGVSVDGDDLLIKLDDFELIAYGANASTDPFTNAYSTQGEINKLRVLDPDTSVAYWVGSPLHFTDRLHLAGEELPSLSAGRDYVVLTSDIGSDQYFIDCFPIRKKLGISEVQVHRADAHVVSKRRVLYTPAYKFSNDVSTAASNEDIEVVDFGSTDYEKTTATALLDGVATAGGLGVTGGATLSQAGTALSPEGYHKFELKEDLIARPNGLASLGIQPGHYVSLAAFSAFLGVSALGPYGNAIDPAGAGFDALASEEPAIPTWWGVGRIMQVGSADGSLGDHQALVAGINDSELLAHGIFDYAPMAGVPGAVAVFNSAGLFGGKYVLNWTVYRGELEVVLPDESLAMSYDEFAFPPAFPHNLFGTNAVTGIGGGESVDYTDEFPYVGMYDSSAAGVVAFNTRTNKRYSPAGGSNPTNWCIIRLKEPIYSQTLENGQLLMKSAVYPRIATITARTQGATVFPVSKTNFGFPAANSRSVANFGVLPVTSDMHEFSWTAGDALATLTFTNPSLNDYHVNGYLVPMSFFSANTHMAQLYDVPTITSADYTITISDMPGGIPTTDVTVLPVTTSPNKIHIGGLTDIYVKTRFNDESLLSGFTLMPSKLGTGGDEDVIFSSNDGSIGDGLNAGVQYYKNVLWSPSLGADAGLDVSSSVLYIENSPDPGLIGKMARIVGRVESGGLFGVQLEEELWSSGLSNPISGITFKVYQRITTNLISGTYPIQEGSDMSVPLSAKTVEIAGTFTFSENPTLATLYLKILSGANVGTYRIVSKTASSLTIEDVVFGPENNIEYSILREQAKLDLPLVSLTGISLSSEDEFTGSVIPRKDCIDAVAGSFVGLNDDPLTGTIGALVVDAALGKFSDATVNSWSALGVIKYDVLKISKSDASTTYYYVTSLDGASLVLDRPVTVARQNLSYTVGHPSVGKVKLYFLDPTYVAVNSDTVFYNQDKSLTFRPSPAEKALVYETSGVATDSAIAITLAAAANTIKITSSTTDYRLADIRAGDYLTFLAKRIRSSAEIAGADELNLVGTSLTFSVGGSNLITTFIGTGNITLSSVVQQLNSSFGALASVSIAPDNLLQVTSSSVVTLVSGSPTALALLHLSIGDTNATGYGDGAIVISKVEYDPVDADWTITASDSDKLTGSDTYSGDIFFQVNRLNTQHVFPAGMSQDSLGLSYAEFTLTSREPWATESVVSGEILRLENYSSLGYSLTVDNINYSYSTYEIVDLGCTAVVLQETATNFLSGFSMPHAKLAIEYTTSSTASSAQDFVLSEQNRVVCNNPLVRTFLPAYPRIALNYTGGVLASTVVSTVQDYLETLYPNRPLEVFDIEAQLAKLDISYLEQPVEVLYIVHDSSRRVSVVRSKDSIILPKGYHITIDDSSVRLSTASNITSATLSSY